MADIARRPHRYDPGPGGAPRCRCKMSRAYRSHQPLLWRLLNPTVRWR